MTEPKSRPIDPEILQELGQFVVFWGLLEGIVADLFVATISSDIGNLFVVTKSVSASTISGWIRTTINFRKTPEAAREEVTSMLDEYDRLRGERNALIHGMWGTDKSGPGTVMVQTIRLDRAVPAVDTLITASDLRDLIDATLGLYVRVRDFMGTNGLAHRTSGAGG
ncbi:MAG: hypothetical protein Q8R92_08895 [Deltaproteobacteria bacterium]|nr:hypothetical protein [Deltaproteobacteria bacterium]